MQNQSGIQKIHLYIMLSGWQGRDVKTSGWIAPEDIPSPLGSEVSCVDGEYFSRGAVNAYCISYVSAFIDVQVGERSEFKTPGTIRLRR